MAPKLKRIQVSGCGVLGPSFPTTTGKFLLLQFPTLNGLQSTLYQSCTQGFKASAHALQVIHCRRDHWVVVTTIQCPPGEVKVYDSVYASVDNGTLCTVQSMFGSHTGLQVTAVNAPKQQGGSDCGVFAIAVSTCLAFGGVPAQMMICQSRMRDHFLSVLRRKCSLSFNIHVIMRTTVIHLLLLCL